MSKSSEELECITMEMEEYHKTIPVHINKVRYDNHYYDWSSDNKCFFRGDEIPEKTKRMYDLGPNPKQTYV